MMGIPTFSHLRSLASRFLAQRGARLLLSLWGLMLLLGGLWVWMPWGQGALPLHENPAKTVLSETDQLLYGAMMAAQRQGDYASAESSSLQITNPMLMGGMLAQRYLDPRYQASRAEIMEWFDHYSDHPHALAMERLSKRRGIPLPRLAQLLIPREMLKGDGYVFHLGRTPLPDGWYHALSLWKQGDYKGSAEAFRAVAKAAEHPWIRSAAWYWNARAAQHLGARAEANTAMQEAAKETTSFYGLLAQAQLHRRIHLPLLIPPVAEPVREHPAVKRAAAWVALDAMEEAEQELRVLYPRLQEAEQKSLTTLAAELGLANLQVRIGQDHRSDNSLQLFASYPMPERMRAAQSVVPPALVLAVARQESGFRADASASGGAQGLMQMLPSTATQVMRRGKQEKLGLAELLADDASKPPAPIARRLHDDRLSIRLGGAYLELLSQEKSIGRNLMRVLAAYNAGPGTVANWQRNGANRITDPLLYLESIPYTETHHYVLQVLTNYWIYQLLMGENPSSLYGLLEGQWPMLPSPPTESRPSK